MTAAILSPAPHPFHPEIVVLSSETGIPTLHNRLTAAVPAARAHGLQAVVRREQALLSLRRTAAAIGRGLHDRVDQRPRPLLLRLHLLSRRPAPAPPSVIRPQMRVLNVGLIGARATRAAVGAPLRPCGVVVLGTRVRGTAAPAAVALAAVGRAAALPPQLVPFSASKAARVPERGDPAICIVGVERAQQPWLLEGASAD